MKGAQTVSPGSIWSVAMVNSSLYFLRLSWRVDGPFWSIDGDEP